MVEDAVDVTEVEGLESPQFLDQAERDPRATVSIGRMPDGVLRRVGPDDARFGKYFGQIIRGSPDPAAEVQYPRGLVDSGGQIVHSAAHEKIGALPGETNAPMQHRIIFGAELK